MILTLSTFAKIVVVKSFIIVYNIIHMEGVHDMDLLKEFSLLLKKDKSYTKNYELEIEQYTMKQS